LFIVAGGRFGMKRLILLVAVVGGVALVAYKVFLGSSGGLFVVDPHGGSSRRVASGCIGEFAWSPDGKALVVQHVDGHQASSKVEVVSLLGGGARAIATDSGQYAWSPDGSKLAYTDHDGQIWVAPLSGHTQRTLVWKGKPSQDGWNNAGEEPAWAPDGGSIAFSVAGSRGGPIAIMRPDGTGHRFLTNKIADTSSPIRWFPDGKRLLFLGTAFGVPLPSLTPLWVINVDGTGLRRVTRLPLTGFGTHYAISPDGRRIAYSYFDGNQNQLYLINVDGSGKRHLRNGDATLGNWSPDGNAVVFWDETQGGAYSVSSDGSGTRKVSAHARPSGGVPDDVALWSTKGQIASVDDNGCFSGPS
jgi:Tol biopolymer transport system component